MLNSTKTIQSLRGMKDIVGSDSELFIYFVAKCIYIYIQRFTKWKKQ